MSAIDTKDKVDVSPAPTPPRRRHYGSIVLGSAFVVVGALWLLDVAGVTEVRAGLVLPAVLALIGLALVIGAFDGPHPGLVVAGVFVGILAVAAALIPQDAFHGGIGEHSYTVTTESDLASRYDVGLGDLYLDLSGLTVTEPADIDINVGAGQIRILLPPAVPVHIDASVGAGDINLLGERTDGLSVERTYQSDDYAGARIRLTFDVNVAAGNIEVDR